MAYHTSTDTDTDTLLASWHLTSADFFRLNPVAKDIQEHNLQ